MLKHITSTREQHEKAEIVTQCAGNTLEVVINRRKYLEKLQKLS